jgi:hypothetical protein
MGYEGTRGNMGMDQGNRRPQGGKYHGNYSPSTSYNYSPGGGGGGYQGQMPRRRADRFKREVINGSDRQLRQNDIIIKLLKEIRDRLPAPQGYGEAEKAPEAVERQEVQPVQENVPEQPTEASAADQGAQDEDVEE